MQETIRAFGAWLDINAKNYKTELRFASLLFWGEREDLAKIEINPDTEMFFNEWLMLDFSVNGYDNVSAEKRENFLNIFLRDNFSELSEGARIFAQNASISFPSFYKISKIKPGSYTDLNDLFLQKEIRSVDKNLSWSGSRNKIIYGRFCQNEKKEYIGAGSQNVFVPQKFFDVIFHWVNGTYKMANEAGSFMSIEQFLKWNSYIFYREIVSGDK